VPDPPRLILASASPRRAILLREAGYDFTLDPAEIDESKYPPGMLPSAMQVPGVGVMPPLMAPTHVSPVAHGCVREQLAPAAASVTQVDLVIPRPVVAVKQVCPRAQVPLLLQSPPVAIACPQVPQAASVSPVQYVDEHCPGKAQAVPSVRVPVLTQAAGVLPAK